MTTASGRINIEDPAALLRYLRTQRLIGGDETPALQDEFADRRFFEELRLEPYDSYTASQVPQARGFPEQ